jgi:mannose-1-phosphate guanylyltransferase
LNELATRHGFCGSIGGCHSKKKRDPQAVMTIQTSDHFIRDKDLFRYLIRTAFDVASKDYLVTLGITPTFPSTGYGYIEQGEPLPEHLSCL